MRTTSTSHTAQLGMASHYFCNITSAKNTLDSSTMKVAICFSFLICAVVSSSAAGETQQTNQQSRQHPGKEEKKQKIGAQGKAKKFAIAKECNFVGDEMKCRLDPNGLELNNEEFNMVLPKASKREFRCERLHPTKNRKAWHGQCDGDMSDVNVVMHKDKRGNDRVFGSFHLGQDVCRIHPNVDGTHREIDCKPQDSFLPEAPPHAGHHDSHDQGLRVAFNNSTSTHHYGMKIADSNGRRLINDRTIDIMVLWTKEAECQNSDLPIGCATSESTEDNMMGLIELAIEETNVAFTQSGINAEMRLVHSYRHSDYAEPTTNSYHTALESLRKIGDGQLDDVHVNRELYGADAVAMIMGTNTYCGIAYTGPSKQFMFSLSNYRCATGYYTFGHEIAHNLGAYHDRGAMNSCGKGGYNFGWRDPDADFRTIMAYNCMTGQCDNMPHRGCTRIQRFSNPAVLYKGKVLGDASTDNARQLNENVGIVARYYPAMNCELDSECDDGKANTEDTCNKETKVCVFADVPNPIPFTQSPAPTPAPSIASRSPTAIPSESPSKSWPPKAYPSFYPTSETGSQKPSFRSSTSPSHSGSPSAKPSTSPSNIPGAQPSLYPFSSSSILPTSEPSSAPSLILSAAPNASRLIPSSSPSEFPTNEAVHGTGVDPHMESIRVSGVNGEVWTTVRYKEAFGSPIAVCTIDYGKGFQMQPAVVRMDNVGPISFDVRIQNPGGKEKLDSCELHCVVVEKGKWQLPNGSRIEAQSYLSTKTNGQADFDGEKQSYMQEYNRPVVLGQVMSFNDERWSTFFSQGNKPQNAAGRGIIKTGKHVGQDPESERNDETIGFIVADPLHIRTREGMEFEAHSGPWSVGGYIHRRRRPYRFRQSFRKAPRVIVLSQAAMRSPEGSWGVLAGIRPNRNQFGVAVDEDQLGDVERFHHLLEPMDYMAFADAGILRLIG